MRRMQMPGPKTLLTALVLGLAAPALAACEDEGPMEQMGENMDEAGEQGADAVEDAADAMEDQADEMQDQAQ